MNARSGRPWPLYLLGLATIGAIVAAVLVVGPPSESTASTTRIVTAQRGVVQSTVSGSGNVEPAKQLDLGFKTSGVVSHIFVSQGQHVVQGQLLAELDPESAEVTLEQARATLKTAEATLAQEEETDGEAGSTDSTAHAASVDYSTFAEGTSTSTSQQGTGDAKPTEPTSTSGSQPGSTKSGTGSEDAATAPSTTTGTTTGTAKRAESPGAKSPHASEKAGAGATKAAGGTTGGSTGSTGSSSTLSSAARSANIASAAAAVKSDKLAVQSAEQALTNTKLYAPETGTLVSLSGEVGENVSATGTTKAASSSASEGSGSSGSSASSAFGASTSASSGTGDSGSGGSSSSSSFAVLSDLSSMQLVVPMSESEIGEVKVGQPATVAIEALESRKMAAEVTAIASLPTSNSGVVSYDVTFTLDQLTEGLRAGMSATAEVIVKEAEGVNVPTSAITGGQVTVVKEGRQTRRSVLTGLAGNSSTIVVSGLSAGEQVALPAASTSTSSASSALSRLGSKLGGAGGFVGGGAFPSGGGGGFAARAFGG